MAQADLFAAIAEPIDPEITAYRRRHLHADLARLQQAERSPYRDLTEAFLADLMFTRGVDGLPEEERGALRAAWAAELVRLKIET